MEMNHTLSLEMGNEVYKQSRGLQETPTNLNLKVSQIFGGELNQRMKANTGNLKGRGVHNKYKSL
jgi:hypothetical protein